MKKIRKITRYILGWIVSLTFFMSLAWSHSIHYDAQQKGISVRIFYAKDDPASYSEYELFGPGDKEPYQIGRTDRNGFLSFLPDRPGVWKVKVWGESSHGYHGTTIDVQVDSSFQMVSFSKPLIATHTKLLVGASLIFGLFGVYALWKSRKRDKKCCGNMSSEK